MIRSLKRLAATLLIAVFIVGSMSVTSAEAAMKKPGNARFVEWEDKNFKSCEIEWDRVAGANAYEYKCTWTDGSHAITDVLYGKDEDEVTVEGLNYKHVYQFQVRALKLDSKKNRKEVSPWSNIVFITPWPKHVKGRLSGSSNVKLSWNIIYGCNGYNVFLSTNPSGKWRWNLSTDTKATSTSAKIRKYRGSKLKKYQNYYVRVITRRKRNGVFCTVPEPSRKYYQFKFYIYSEYQE